MKKRKIKRKSKLFKCELISIPHNFFVHPDFDRLRVMTGLPIPDLLGKILALAFAARQQKRQIFSKIEIDEIVNWQSKTGESFYNFLVSIGWIRVTWGKSLRLELPPPFKFFSPKSELRKRNPIPTDPKTGRYLKVRKDPPPKQNNFRPAKTRYDSEGNKIDERSP